MTNRLCAYASLTALAFAGLTCAPAEAGDDKSAAGTTIVEAPATRVETDERRTRVQVRAPATDVDTERRRVRIRVPFFDGVIRW